MRLDSKMIPKLDKLGEDVINFYKPYRNDDTNWRTIVVSNIRF